MSTIWLISTTPQFHDRASKTIETSPRIEPIENRQPAIAAPLLVPSL